MITTTIILMKRRERGGNKTQAKEVAQYNCAPPTDRCPAHPWAVIVLFQPAPPVYTLSVAFHGVEWPFGQFRSAPPGHAPSQLLVHLLAGRSQETEKSLTQGKSYLATTKTSVCYQHYSLIESKTLYRLLGRKFCPSQSEDGLLWH